MALPDLQAVLTAKTDGFEAALNRAVMATEGASSRIKGSTERINASLSLLKGAAAGLASVLTVRAFAGLITGSIDAADRLNDLSKKTGISVETLGGLGFAAGQAGGDLESISAAAGKLNKSIAEAAAGNKGASDAFDVLGISVRDSSGNIKKADVVMIEIADRFARFEDGPNKAALALKLFGKAGADIIPVLNDGGSALRENIKFYGEHSRITADVARRADEFNDAMGKLRVQAQGLGQAIATDLLPFLTRLVTAFNDLRNPGVSFGKALNSFALSGMPNEDVQQRLDFQISALKDLQRQQKDFEDQTRNGGDFFGNFFVDDKSSSIELAKKNIAELQGILGERDRLAKEAIYGPGGAGAAAGKAPSLPGTGGGTGRSSGRGRSEADRSARDAEAIAKAQIDQQIKAEDAAFAKLTDAHRLYESNIAKLRGAGLVNEREYYAAREQSQSEFADIITAARDKEIAILTAAQGKADPKQRIDYQTRINDLQTKFNALLDDLGDSKAGDALDRYIESQKTFLDFQKQIDDINAKGAQTLDALAFVGAGGLDDQSEQTRQRFLELFRDTSDGAKDTADEMSEFFVQAAHNMQDAMATGFFDIMQGNFSDLGTTFKRTIDKMVADVLAAKAATALFGDFGKGGNANLGGLVGDAASWFSKMSFADGGIMTSAGPLPLNRYAGGGIANRPQMAMFGEGSMSEAIIPLPDGRSVPVRMQGGGGMSNVYNINVTAAPGATRETANQAADAFMRKLQSARARNG